MATKVYVPELTDYILDLSTQYDWVNSPSERQDLDKLVEAKYGNHFDLIADTPDAKLSQAMQLIEEVRASTPPTIEEDKP